ncbi:MAG TPA: TorF family putative porin [Xanthobacteraceae bacterium]|jgi:uncharacterized protein (TIGR02001 family)|nr:TorF family putative porin [Xanthobacteraceae bacterium]
MKTAASIAVIVLGVSALPALAADLGKMVTKAPVAAAAAPSPFDLAFGGGIANDYIFRGITQSNHKPSVNAYFEPRYNVTPDLQLYAGVAGESIDFPNRAAAEVDFYGGFRPTFGKLALDVGVWYYYYPGGQTYNGASAANCTNGFIAANGACNTLKGDVSFYEIYAKPTYTFDDYVTAGANVFYSPSWLNSGAYGTYASGTLKLTAPANNILPKDVGFSVSGELGRYWLGTTDAFYGNVKYPDYTTWNVGVDFTYKVFTLDLRYSDTDLSKADCNVLTSDQTASFNPSNITSINPSGLGSKWCGAAFIAKLSADLTLGSLK